ncbi:unnamed protein product, partial [Prorocentrum cordatum]
PFWLKAKPRARGLGRLGFCLGARAPSRDRRGDRRRGQETAAQRVQSSPITDGHMQDLVDSNQSMAPVEAQSHPTYMVPPTSPCRVEGYRLDARRDLKVPASLVLAARIRRNDDGEAALQEIPVRKQSFAALGPIDTRIRCTMEEVNELEASTHKRQEQIERLTGKTERESECDE